jgi:hypothetical protein
LAKKEALAKIQAIVQEHREGRQPSIATTDANTMNETTLVSSPFVDNSLETIDDFEKNTKGIGSKMLR